MGLEELKNKATELGIEFDDEVTEDDLNTLISDKEEELSSDLDYLKDELTKYKNEAKKAFEKRDTANRDKRKLADKVKELEKRLDSSVDKEKLEELQESLKELKEFKAEADRKAEEAEMKKLDDVQRTKLQFEKQMEEMKKDMESMKKDFSKKEDEALNRQKKDSEIIERLRGSKLETEILRAASKYNAFNPDQIVALTKAFFTYDKQLEKYSNIVRDKNGNISDELTVDEYIKTFLGKEENENLVKSSASQSSFDTKTQNRSDNADKGKKKSAGTGKYKADDPQIIEEAGERNLEPEEWARIKEKQEAKLTSMREKNKK